MSDVRPEDFSLLYSEEFKPYPFYEDDNGNITGYGHQDPQEFAAEIVRYDQETAGEYSTEVDEYLSHIDHKWAIMDTTGEYFTVATASTEDAFPITTLWGYK